MNACIYECLCTGCTDNGSLVGIRWSMVGHTQGHCDEASVV